MNKAFVREPEFDGRAFCPRCGALGEEVHAPTLDAHIRSPARMRLNTSAWFCPFPRCDVAYYNLFEAVVTTDELAGPVYPKDPEAPICACFDFTHSDVAADVEDGTPTRIRQLLEKSKSTQASCQKAAADGKCCLPQVQKLYMKLCGQAQGS